MLLATRATAAATFAESVRSKEKASKSGSAVERESVAGAT